MLRPLFFAMLFLASSSVFGQDRLQRIRLNVMIVSGASEKLDANADPKDLIKSIGLLDQAGRLIHSRSSALSCWKTKSCSLVFVRTFLPGERGRDRSPRAMQQDPGHCDSRRQSLQRPLVSRMMEY